MKKKKYNVAQPKRPRLKLRGILFTEVQVNNYLYTADKIQNERLSIVLSEK